MSDQEPLDILVVDDEPELREQLRRLFARDGHRVVPVADGRAAVDRASTARFDIILLDVALGAAPDGYEVCRQLRDRHNVTPIIMLTALDSEADAVLGLEAGADDYVTKPFGPAELRSRIRAVLRRAGPRALGEEVLQVGPLVLDRSRRTVTAEGRPAELTFSEFEVLQALMSRSAAALVAVSVLTVVVTALLVLASLDRKLEQDALASLDETTRGARSTFAALRPEQVRAGSQKLDDAVRDLRRQTDAQVSVFDA